MRLIDADEFKKQIAGMAIINNFPADKANTMCELYDAQPTAYDVDRVVEQLEEKSELARKKCTIYPVHNPLYDRHDTQYQDLKMCLEIVKGGGVNE